MVDNCHTHVLYSSAMNFKPGDTVRYKAGYGSHSGQLHTVKGVHGDLVYFSDKETGSPGIPWYYLELVRRAGRPARTIKNADLGHTQTIMLNDVDGNEVYVKLDLCRVPARLGDLTMFNLGGIYVGLKKNDWVYVVSDEEKDQTAEKLKEAQKLVAELEAKLKEME